MSKPRTYLFVIPLLFTCLPFLASCTGDTPSFKTEYQAIFLDNGQVFFGKLSNAGAAYPLLKDVYYIGRQSSPDGKEVRNILLKRGGEWHGPDLMYLNRQHVVIIEPVAPNSRVAQLIKEVQIQAPQPQQQQPQPPQQQQQQKQE